MSNDKPAPVIHLGTLATACGLRSITGFPGTGDIEKVTCPECVAQEERRKRAVALSNVNPRPIDDVVEVTVTLRADLVQAMTPELGPKMARAAVLGPDAYDSAMRPMHGYISVGADGSLTPVTVSPPKRSANSQAPSARTWRTEPGAARREQWIQ